MTDSKDAKLSQADREQLAQKIEAVSPDGRPAHPQIGPRGIGKMLLLFALVVLIAGVVVGVWLSRPLGIAIAVVGAVLFVFNPTVWAAVGRARERGKINRGQSRGEPRSK
ncbi:MAG TPA: hypothetical protein PKE29_10285 [Phycisphaerales bacterium]|nr:hypothetical protein [Phycisphaerales bacterium]